jgi:head-tail adaptor
MIPAPYVTALKVALANYAYSDHVQIWRNVNQSDGIGGISQHWIQVAEIRATIANTGDSEGIVGGMIEQAGTWTLTCSPEVEVKADDRIYTSGNPQNLAPYYEVIGSDWGHSNEVSQTIALRSRSNG